MNGAIVSTVLVLAATGMFVAASVAARRSSVRLPPSPFAARPILKLSATLVALAYKWAAARGLPVAWVITFINNEGAKPDAHIVTANEDSYGVMQINVRAQAETLKKLGVSASQLLDPDVNIMVGTYIMRSYYDSLVQALAGRTPPIDMGLLLRLSYTAGIGKVRNVLKAGGGAAELQAVSPRTVTAWGETLARVQALV